MTINIPKIESNNTNLKYNINQINFEIKLLINKYEIKRKRGKYYYKNYFYGTEFTHKNNL